MGFFPSQRWAVDVPARVKDLIRSEDRLADRHRDGTADRKQTSIPSLLIVGCVVVRAQGRTAPPPCAERQDPARSDQPTNQPTRHRDDGPLLFLFPEPFPLPPRTFGTSGGNAESPTARAEPPPAGLFVREDISRTSSTRISHLRHPLVSTLLFSCFPPSLGRPACHAPDALFASPPTQAGPRRKEAGPPPPPGASWHHSANSDVISEGVRLATRTSPLP